MKPILPLLLLLAGLPSLHAYSEFGDIRRKVLNPDGNAAAGVKVIVIQKNTERSEPEIITTGETNAEGVFSGRALIPEHWKRGLVSTLVLGKEGEIAFESNSYQIDKIPDTHPDITLEESTTLKTRIIDADGNPVPNIRMRISQIADDSSSKRMPFSMPVPLLPDGTWSAVSDEDGRCVIGRVPPGLRFYLTHDSPSFSQPHGENNIYVSWQTPMSDGDEYEIVLPQPGSVSGRILLPDGTPAGNVEFNILETYPYVTSFSTSAYTDEDGRYHIPSVPPSDYRIRIELVPPLDAEWVAAEMEPVKVGDEAPTVLPDITLIEAAEVTAEIVDAVTGEVIDDPLIVLLPPGSQEVRYRSHRGIPDGYLDGKLAQKIDVKAGERRRITFKLNPATDDHLITGKVVDENGVAVPEAAVALFSSSSWGMSSPLKAGADGRFRIVQNEDLKGGSAIASNMVDAVSDRVPAEPGVELTLVLKKSGFAKVKGTVRDEAGNPIRKARVGLSHETLSAGFRPEYLFGNILLPGTRTDDDGAFTIENVWVGLRGYHISVRAQGCGDAGARNLDFSAGDSKEVNFTLKSAGESLSGTVVDADGVPVSKAWVNCSGSGQPGGFAQVFTDEKGQFVLEPLVKGLVYIDAGKYDEKSSRETRNTKAQIPCEPVRIMLPVAEGVVGGKVVDADGGPVAGAEVSAGMKQRKTISDENGEFRITGLMAGWFDIEATLEPDDQPKTVAEQRAKPGMEDIILRLEPEKPFSKPRPEEPLDLIGQVAADIEVETWFNSPPHPAKAGGKVRILDFWGLECAPCIATMPKIAKFWDKAPQDKLEIIALTGTYHDDEIREFLARHPDYKFSFAKRTKDSTAHRDYDIRGIPTYVVIGTDGKIVSYGHDWEKASATALAEIGKIK